MYNKAYCEINQLKLDNLNVNISQTTTENEITIKTVALLVSHCVLHVRPYLFHKKLFTLFTKVDKTINYHNSKVNELTTYNSCSAPNKVCKAEN